MDIIIKDRVQAISSEENSGQALGYVSSSDVGFSTAGTIDDFSDHLWISQSNDNTGFAGTFTGTTSGYTSNARYVESGVTYTTDELKVNLYAHATALFLGNISADSGTYVQYTCQNIKGNPRHIQTDTSASDYIETTLDGQFTSIDGSAKVSRSIPVTTGTDTLSHLTKDQFILPVKVDTYNITNVTGVTNTSITYTVGNHDIVVGDYITVIGITAGSGGDLNLTTETIVASVTATTVTIAIVGSLAIGGDEDPSNGKLLNKNPQGQKANYFRAKSVADTSHVIATDNLIKGTGASATVYTFTIGTHDFQVGDFVEIKDVHSNFNGIHKINTVPASTSITIIYPSEPSVPSTLSSATANLYRITGDEEATRTYTTTTTDGTYGSSATNINPAKKGLYRTSISLRIYNQLNRFVRGELTERTSTWASFPYNSSTSSLLIKLRSYVNRQGQVVVNFKKDTAGTTEPTGHFIDSAGDAVSTETHGSIKVGSYVKLSTNKYYQITKIIGDGTTNDSITIQKGHDGTSITMDLDTAQNYAVTQIVNPISIGILRSGFAKNFKNAKVGLGQQYKDYSFRRLLSNGSLQYQNRNVARIFSGSITHDEDSATELRLFSESQRAKPFAVLLLSNMNLENKVSMYAYFPDLPTERFQTRKADYKETSFKLQEVL